MADYKYFEFLEQLGNILISWDLEYLLADGLCSLEALLGLRVVLELCVDRCFLIVEFAEGVVASLDLHVGQSSFRRVCGSCDLNFQSNGPINLIECIFIIVLPDILSAAILQNHGSEFVFHIPADCL